MSVWGECSAGAGLLSTKSVFAMSVAVVLLGRFLFSRSEIHILVGGMLCPNSLSHVQMSEADDNSGSRLSRELHKKQRILGDLFASEEAL